MTSFRPDQRLGVPDGVGRGSPRRLSSTPAPWPALRLNQVFHEKQDPAGPTAPGPRPLVTGQLPPPDEPSAGPDPVEQSTVARARQGDQEAFRTLVEQNQDRILRLAMRVLHSDRATAEDLCQEVFLRAFRGLPGFDGAVRFSTWLHTIGMNVCISEYRRRRSLKRNRPTLSIDQPIAGEDDLCIEPTTGEVDPSARADQREFAETVRRVIHELPDEFRDAVLLRDMQDLSYEEIGEILAVPPGTVRSRIHRGRLLLQEKLRGFE